MLVAFLLSAPFFIHAQGQQKVYEDIFRHVEEMAMPDFKWSEYLIRNLQYPDAALENNIQGKVYIEFIVEKDGSIRQPRIVRGKEIGYGIPEEALRLISNSPKWKAGRQKNQPVRSYFTMPVNFSIPQDAIRSDGNAPTGGDLLPKIVVLDRTDENEIFRTVEVMPQSGFNPGAFLSANLRYPDLARENQVQGRVIVQFVVEKDGSLTDIKLVKGAEIGYGIPEEAIRVVKSMPKWKPGMHKGKVVRTYYSLPIHFVMQ